MNFLSTLQEIKFEKVTGENSPYNPEFVKKIRKGEKDIAKGKGKSGGVCLDEIRKALVMPCHPLKSLMSLKSLKSLKSLMTFSQKLPKSA